jgi:small-conductance mechanosensitive channel
VIWGIALIIMLDQTGIDVSPLIASLGIGGLAIAIAVQPTLSNFMAGTYVISDSVIKKGHYIILDTGQEVRSRISAGAPPKSGTGRVTLSSYPTPSWLKRL